MLLQGEVSRRAIKTRFCNLRHDDVLIPKRYRYDLGIRPGDTTARGEDTLFFGARFRIDGLGCPTHASLEVSLVVIGLIHWVL